MKTARWLSPLFTLLVTLLLCSCSTERVAGGTDLPNQIYGWVVLPDSTPAIAATVALLSADSGELRFRAPLATTITDAQGAYSFRDVAEGVFALTAVSADSSFALAVARVVVGGDSLQKEVWVEVIPAGRLVGKVVTPLADYRVTLHLMTTPYTVVADQSGAFAFPPLPAGSYLLAMIITDPATGRAALGRSDSVTIGAGATTTLDSLAIDPLGAASDTLELTEFTNSIPLDAGGPWEAVKVDTLAEQWTQYSADLSTLRADTVRYSGTAGWRTASHLATRVLFQILGEKGASGEVWIDDVRIIH